MFGRKRKSSQANAIGCGFILSMGLLISALLILNALVVKAFLSANLANADARIIQAFQFVAPVVMIFFEFWFYDMINRRHIEDDD